MKKINKSLEAFIARKYGWQVDVNFEYSYKKKLIYSRLAFELCELTKKRPEEIAKEIALNVREGPISLEAKEGFINLKISKEDLLGILEKEAKNINLKNLLEEKINLADRVFDKITYAYIKLSAGFMELWDKNNTSYDNSYELALFLFYTKKREETIKHLADLFYSFDRKTIGRKIPYSLYLVIFNIITNYLSKSKSTCSLTTVLFKAPK